MKLKVNTPLVQLARQVQYLIIALLFAGFAVTANAGIAIGKELARNKWEIATKLDDNVQCAGGKVEVRGKLNVEFEKVRRDGREVVVPKTVEQNGQKFLPKDASNGVGADAPALRPNRTFKIDKVELDEKVGLRFGTMVIRIFFVAKPNAVNTAQGDVSPGKTFTFRAVYKKVEWNWNDNDKVTEFRYSESFARCP
jgi:hypothetical protein